MTPTHAAVSPPCPAPEPAPESGSAGGVVVDTRFGLMEFDPARAIAMPGGIPGFSHAKRFGLGPLPGVRGGQFLLMQSLDDAALSFIVLPTAAEGGMIAAADLTDACAALGIDVAAAAVLLIVTVREAMGERQLSVNLRAPVIVDTASQRAWQHVLGNGAYPVRHILSRAQPQGSAA